MDFFISGKKRLCLPWAEHERIVRKLNRFAIPLTSNCLVLILGLALYFREDPPLLPLMSVLPLSITNPSDVLDMPVDPNEPTYCLCHQVSYGEMIGCDNPDVSITGYSEII